MKTYDDAIRRMRENMLKQVSAEQAKVSLQKCGVLNENNQVVSAYRKIVVRTVTEKKVHEHK